MKRRIPKMTDMVPIKKNNPNLRFDGDELTLNQIPNPTGYRIILAPISIEQETVSSIILTRDTQKAAETTRFIAKVLKMGPLVYKHDKYKEHPNATAVPWCKVGDIVSIGQYTGSQLPCKNAKGESYILKVVNDDEIVTVITDASILDV